MKALKLLLRGAQWTLLVASAVAAAVVIVALLALKPRDGEWSVGVGHGRLERELSMPTLLRWGTHPLARAQLDGRTLAFRGNRWALQQRPDGSLQAHCAPCRLHLPALGAEPLVLPSLRLVLRSHGADRYDGSVWLGEGKGAVVLPWRGELRQDSFALQAELPGTPVAQLVALFGDAVPEARRARIEGTFAVKLEATLGAQGLVVTKLKPVLAGVAVSGLGTEALVDADASARCRPQPSGGRVEGWIQNAVIAAEDQRFMEHPGYELDAWVAVWKRNQREPDALQGASTITQQLAKLLFTGDERSAARKVREWLYAVEMERTLGKGRILQLYLAVLPWGDGICGAEAAARHHLGKPANQLKPREAAWLASLLINPDQQLRRWASDEAGARERAATVLAGIRRLPRERREAELDALQRWRPPIGRAAS